MQQNYQIPRYPAFVKDYLFSIWKYKMCFGIDKQLSTLVLNFKTYFNRSAMRKLFIISLLYFPLSSQSQSNQQIDSMVTILCNNITHSKEEIDSIKIKQAFEEYLPSFLKDMKDATAQFTFEEISLRLQTRCKAFWTILERNTPKNSFWQTIDKFSETSCSKEDCEQLFKKKNLYYFEPTGDTTKLNLSNGFWVDLLSDGTYSKLGLKRINFYEFEISFIESNNSIKQKLSRKGDTYVYRIVQKENNYYVMQVGIPNAGRFSQFRIYYY